MHEHSFKNCILILKCISLLLTNIIVGNYLEELTISEISFINLIDSCAIHRLVRTEGKQDHLIKNLANKSSPATVQS